MSNVFKENVVFSAYSKFFGELKDRATTAGSSTKKRIHDSIKEAFPGLDSDVKEAAKKIDASMTEVSEIKMMILGLEKKLEKVQEEVATNQKEIKKGLTILTEAIQMAQKGPAETSAELVKLTNAVDDTNKIVINLMGGNSRIIPTIKKQLAGKKDPTVSG